MIVSIPSSLPSSSFLHTSSILSPDRTRPPSRSSSAEAPTTFLPSLPHPLDLHRLRLPPFSPLSEPISFSLFLLRHGSYHLSSLYSSIVSILFLISSITPARTPPLLALPLLLRLPPPRIPLLHHHFISIVSVLFLTSAISAVRTPPHSRSSSYVVAPTTSPPLSSPSSHLHRLCPSPHLRPPPPSSPQIEPLPPFTLPPPLQLPPPPPLPLPHHRLLRRLCPDTPAAPRLLPPTTATSSISHSAPLIPSKCCSRSVCDALLAFFLQKYRCRREAK